MVAAPLIVMIVGAVNFDFTKMSVKFDYNRVGIRQFTVPFPAGYLEESTDDCINTMLAKVNFIVFVNLILR